MIYEHQTAGALLIASFPHVKFATLMSSRCLLIKSPLTADARSMGSSIAKACMGYKSAVSFWSRSSSQKSTSSIKKFISVYKADARIKYLSFHFEKRFGLDFVFELCDDFASQDDRLSERCWYRAYSSSKMPDGKLKHVPRNQGNAADSSRTSLVSLFFLSFHLCFCAIVSGLDGESERKESEGEQQHCTASVDISGFIVRSDDHLGC
jgi:hypothetical protein